jgi:hypothetical protein
MTEPIIIKDFESGIADSPHKGIGNLKNVDIDAFVGSIKVKPALLTLFNTAVSDTVTAAVTGVCTCASMTGNANTTGQAVKFTTTTTLPAGLTANTVYFVIRVSQPGGTFKVAETIALANAGTAVVITDTGTGTHTVATVNPGTIKHIIKDPRINIRYFQDSNGRIWYLTDGATLCKLLFNATLDNAKVGSAALANASGNGMVTFLNSNASATYLLAFRNAVIDIINVFVTTNFETPSWTNAWNFGGVNADAGLVTGAGTGNLHHAIVGQDNIIYFTDDRYIGSIKEIAGQVFTPSNTATYAGNNLALDTPLNEVLTYLEELGTNLLASGNTFNRIYPWDRISDSYNLPLVVPENHVGPLVNLGNLVYIFAGEHGNIYTTQGTYVRFFKKLPEHLTNNSGSIVAQPVTWGGVAIFNGSILFGAGVQTSGNSGVYRIYPDGRLLIDQIPTTAGRATAIEASGDSAVIDYLVGFASGANYHDTNRYSSFEGIMQSQFYRVATKTEKGTLSTLEVVIAQPVSTGNVRIKYRVDTSSSFGNFPNGATSFAADGSTTTFSADIGLMDLENLQVQAEIDGNVELVEIRLLP